MKNKFENHYRKLLKKCLINGTERKDRTGVGSYSILEEKCLAKHLIQNLIGL